MDRMELALQKLNELREVAPEESHELLDGLATLFVLRQDMTNPMLGAKVTLWEKPPGEWVDITFEEYKELYEGTIDADDPEDAVGEHERSGKPVIQIPDRFEKEPWWLSWRRHSDNHVDVPEGEYRHEFRRYMKWEHESPAEVDEADVPTEIREAGGVGAMTEAANAREGEEWRIYRVGQTEEGRRTVFKRNRLVPCEDFVGHRAIVIESSIAEQPSETEFWDPNRGEYTTPDDYPMGTVNVVLPEDPWAVLGEDYTYEMRVETSVTPAEGEPADHTYTPGWGDD